MMSTNEQLTTDINEMKQSNSSLEEQLNKITADNESLKASNDRLKEDLDPLGISDSPFHQFFFFPDSLPIYLVLCIMFSSQLSLHSILVILITCNSEQAEFTGRFKL